MRPTVKRTKRLDFQNTRGYAELKRARAKPKIKKRKAKKRKRPLVEGTQPRGTFPDAMPPVFRKKNA